jgi:myosin heavy subunit
MPTTDVEIQFIINDAKAKGQLQALRAEGQRLIEMLKRIGETPESMGAGAFSARQLAGMRAYREEVEQTTGASKELREETEGATDIFSKMEGMITRIISRMAIMEVTMAAVREVTKRVKDEFSFSQQEAVFKNLYGDTQEVVKGFADIRKELGDDVKKVTEFEEVMRDLDTTGTATFEDLRDETEKLTKVSDEYGLSAKRVAAEIERIGDAGRVTTKELQDLNREFRGAFSDQLAAAKNLDDQINQVTDSIKDQENANRDLKQSAAEMPSARGGRGAGGIGGETEEQARAALIQKQMQVGFGPGKAPAEEAAYRRAVAERPQREERAREEMERTLQRAQEREGQKELQGLRDQLAQLKAQREQLEKTVAPEIRGKVLGLEDQQKLARARPVPIEQVQQMAPGLLKQAEKPAWWESLFSPVIAPIQADLKKAAEGIEAIMHIFQGGH